MGTTTSNTRRLVLLIGADRAWLEELRKLLNPQDWQFALADSLETLPARLAERPVHAVVLAPREYHARDLHAFRACRTNSPGTALVVMCENPASPALKRALERGPSACLAWPASPEAVLDAIHCAVSPHQG
jgi:DNA-binding NtrC family response regulator